jgi:serine/threonine protein kinase
MSSPPHGQSWHDDLAADLEKDPRIGAYDLLGPIGEGSSGTVYRARHRALGQLVALKKLRATSDIARERFRREARTAAALRHPHLAAIHDAGDDYLVMELVEGAPFEQRPRDERLRLLVQAARGVGAAHAAGVTHRDLKPANVLVGPEGAKVVDFGLAHLENSSLTSEGATLGTPLYMAPEQIEGGPVSPRTDVYALGAMLYEVLAGHPPFRADATHALYAKILHDAPPRLGAGPLETVARQALEKNPLHRYADADAFADDLQRALDGRTIHARRRLRLPGWAWKAAILLGVALLVWGERQRRVELLREHARVALDAVLKLRRAGDVAGMAAFVPAVEAAYARAPELAET